MLNNGRRLTLRRLTYLIILVLFALVAIWTSGCSPSANVVRAEAYDWVWGIEELESGAARIWLRHDNIAGYCTSDPDLAKLAKDAGGDYVKITFVSMRWADDESWGSSGCARLATGAESSTPIFKLTGIERLEEN